MGIIMNIKYVMIARFGSYDVLLHWGLAFQSKSKRSTQSDPSHDLGIIS